MTSFKPEVSTDGGDSFAGNALRFATEAEAQAYVDDLACRWMLVTDRRVATSDDPVNYVWRNGSASPID